MQRVSRNRTKGFTVVGGSRRRKAGFTLVEVVAAVCVMALVITTSITVLQSGMRTIDNARCTTLAGQILQSQMEKLRLLTWSQLTSTTTGPIPPTSDTHYISPTSSWFTPDVSAATNASEIQRFITVGGAGTCLQTIAAAPSPFNTTMRDITLMATWAGIDKKTHTLSYTTRYGQNGISDFFYTVH